MTAAEAIALLGRVRAHLREAPAYAEGERNALLSELAALQCALATPALLCTRDELFDAVVCADVDAETEGPSLLDELLEQIETSALVAAASARLQSEIREDLEDLERDTHPPDPSEGP